MTDNCDMYSENASEPKTGITIIFLCFMPKSAHRAVLPGGPIRATPNGFIVTTGGNRSTWRKSTVLAIV